MQNKFLRLLTVTLIWVASAASALRAQQHKTEVAVEDQLRQGLPHLVQKLNQGKAVTIAYLGGSITAQDGGWRDQTFQYLQQRYPKATLTQVNAAVSGTGSTLGAFRLEHDVLVHHPDLLFVEFTVNDTGGVLTQDAIEGIVRQTWSQNSDTDICFVYTVSNNLLSRLLSGHVADSTQEAENVAEYYGIPAINFGVDIAERVRSGNMVMIGPKGLSSSAEVFSADGTHPYPETGHIRYRDAFVRAFDRMQDIRIADTSSRRRPPLDANAIDQPLVLSLDDLHITGKWQPAHLSDPTGQLERSLPQVSVARDAGASIQFSFTGNLFGIYGIKGPDVGKFMVSIDDQPPIVTTLFDPYSTAGRYRIRTWFSELLPNKSHRVRITVMDEPIDKAAILAKNHDTIDDPNAFSAHAFYLGAILVNGKMTKSETVK